MSAYVIKGMFTCQHCYCREKIVFDLIVDYRECCWCGDLKPTKEVAGVPG